MKLSYDSGHKARRRYYYYPTSSLRYAMMTASLLLMPLLGGCAGKYNAADMDRDVYKIVDGKWNRDMGSRANYRISDSDPAAEDLKPERLPNNLGILTMSQAVALATAQNRQYQMQREALYQKALDLRLTGHQFEQRFFGSFGAGTSGDRNNGSIDAEGGVGFNQLMADGTQIGLRLGQAWARVLYGDWEDGLATLLDVSVAKPLLRGSRRDVVLEPLKQADRDVLYQVRAFNRYRKTFVVSVISEYYRTLLLKDVWQNTLTHRQALLKLRDHTQILAEGGRVPKLEVERLDQELLKTDDLILESRHDYEQAMDEFKMALSINPSIQFQLDDQEMAILQKSKLDLPAFAESQIVTAALARRLDLANEADRLEDSKRKVTAARDRLQADISLVGRSNTSSHQIGNRGTNNEYDVGVQFDGALDRVAEQNLLRQAEIAVTQQQRTYDGLADQIHLEIRRAYRHLYNASQQHQIQKEAMDLAQKRLDSTYLMLRHSRASSRRVLQALDDLYLAKNTAAAAVVDYSIATLEFYRDSGVLHVRPDGMWEL